MQETTTTKNGAKASAELKWPTATAVANRLGCSRQQVYKLETKGKLKAQDVRSPNGSTKVRRFDPETVELLAASEELETLLEEPDEDAGDADDVGNGGASSQSLKLAAKVVADSRQLALDARRGQQEAYELVATPSREYTKLLMAALEQREKRIAELEEKLNKFYDEQREARAEEREAQFAMSRLEREDGRKDQFFKMFTDNLPVLLEQLKQGLAGGGGPFVDWMKKRTPEQQLKLVMAIEAVMGEDSPPPQKEGPTDA